MAKIQQLSELEQRIAFTEFDIYQSYRKSFDESELGHLYSIFPFSEISKELDLRSKRIGRKSYFSSEGKVALMVLKAYTNFSDAELVEHLNGNIHYQIFCGCYIHPDSPLTNSKLISSIRCEIASRLNIQSIQEVLIKEWKPYLDNLHVCMTDATCYESHLRYPTNAKLLWESCQWLHTWIVKFSRTYLHQRCPRNKYNDVKDAYMAYSRKRNRRKKDTKVIRRRLLQLLEKQLGQMNELLSKHGDRLALSEDFQRRLSVIGRVLKQEKSLFEGNPVSNRIVSIDKSYIRPIVRGKEVKKVEFGAKSNNIQIDGISFIEHLSFDAFNEGTRLRQCIYLHQKLTGTPVRALAADAIYATNANRKYCTKRNITTSFRRKGKESKDEDQRKILRSALSRERATRLEGSFGTQKQHYSLLKVRARRELTEILWIFFGIHTSNAVLMIEKVKRKQIPKAA